MRTGKKKWAIQQLSMGMGKGFWDSLDWGGVELESEFWVLGASGFCNPSVIGGGHEKKN